MPGSDAHSKSTAYSGYYRKISAEPDYYLCQVGRGTPGGEYHRRFWQPVCYETELGDVPMRVRALGEDLVAFKDLRGRIGVLHLHCCHRNSSLEYGMLTDKGIRCCYHGRVFDIDGAIVEMPGEPAADRLRHEATQGAYPTHTFAGIVFTYMGPPDRIPVFPILDRFRIKGLRLVPGVRFESACNWMQIKENAVDPHHTQILHVIPQMRGMDHFAAEFGNFPELTWAETPAGVIYLAVRRVDDNLWIRSAETFGSNIHQINSIFESGREVKSASLPFMTFWTLPVDDDRSITFFVSHVAETEAIPFEKRRALEIFGQYNDRPYRTDSGFLATTMPKSARGRLTSTRLNTSGRRTAVSSCFAGLYDAGSGGGEKSGSQRFLHAARRRPDQRSPMIAWSAFPKLAAIPRTRRYCGTSPTALLRIILCIRRCASWRDAFFECLNRA